MSEPKRYVVQRSSKDPAASTVSSNLAYLDILEEDIIVHHPHPVMVFDEHNAIIATGSWREVMRKLRSERII